MSNNNKWMAFGALICAVYVIMGAFGAHGIEDKIDVKSLATYQTGLRYMIIHGIGLILVNFIAKQYSIAVKWVNISMLIGILLFSFSLTIHACKELLGIDYNAFAMIAPFGGVAYVVSWLIFSLKLLKI